MADREALFAAFNAKTHARERADARYKELSRAVVDAAEDPVALEEIEKNMETLHHQIEQLDVEIAALEQEIADAGGPNV